MNANVCVHAGREKGALTELRHGLEGDDGHARTVDDLHMRRDAGGAHQRRHLEEGPLLRVVVVQLRGVDDEVRVAAFAIRSTARVSASEGDKGTAQLATETTRTRLGGTGSVRRSRTCRRHPGGSGA